jgi:hypothetical protein
MAEPAYSRTVPVPPPMPMRAIRARMMSLAETPGFSVAVHENAERFRGPLQQALGGEDVFDFAGADAEGQRAESAVRGGVAVAADHGHAGLRQAQFRSDDVHDALMAGMHSVARDAEITAVLLELLDLFGERSGR